MLQKINEAFRIFKSHPVLFSTLILTIWLPGNIVIEYIRFYSPIEANEAQKIVQQFTTSIQTALSPIYIGAIIYSVDQIKQGHFVTYGDAISVGWTKWWKIFASRFLAGLLILLGSFFFIIPGVILGIRYSLITAVVVLEETSALDSLQRSSVLTEGNRWKILGAVTLFSIGFLIIRFFLYTPLQYVAPLNNIVINVVLDCILDILGSVIEIILFLFYWETRQR